jgi:excisionase family DNA binding protein
VNAGGNVLGDGKSGEQAPGKPRQCSPSAQAVAAISAVQPEHVIVSTGLDPFLPLRAVAAYSGLSVRTLRQYLDLPPDQALPCYRVGGKILVRRSEFDAWMTQYQARGRPELVRALKALGLDKRDA